MSLKSDGRVSLSSGLLLVLLSVLGGSLACTNRCSAQTLTTLVSFNGSNGSEPAYGNLASDANGNLFGTNFRGGQYGDGTVFEIVKTASGFASTPTILVNFDGTDGAYPEAGMITDANGDLFGTTSAGGAFGDGTVFEIAKTTGGYASTPTILVSFDGSDGAVPMSNLIADANGDLFGTASGGATGNGVVFEIAKTAGGYASTPTILVSFDGSDGAVPMSNLIADANGDLFGTTLLGGASGDGTAFEIVETSTGYDPAPITLVSFDGTEGQYPLSGLIMDASGNLFGTTVLGGAYGDGTVFEIVETSTGYDPAPITLVSFDGADGAFPTADLIADANGSLFGTTSGGGTSGSNGTVFKIAKNTSGYASTPTTLVNFDGNNGAGLVPYSGLIADFNGNLFGTTASGGAFTAGTAFEVSDSGFVPPKQFAGTPGAPNCVGDSISRLAQTFGGVAHAAMGLGYTNVTGLQSAVNYYCSQ